MTFWRKNDPRSEYEGRGTLRNTGFPKGADALNAHDKLRLQSLTGQEEDPLAEPDPYHWQGDMAVEEEASRPVTEEQILRDADPYPKGY